MYIKSLLLTIALILAQHTFGQKTVNSRNAYFTGYTIENMGMSNNDDYIVKVTASDKNIEKATEKAIKCAIYDVISNNIVTDNKTINDNEDYFSAFFDSPDYAAFAEALTNTASAPVKIKGGFRVTKIICVKKDALRKKLENDKIIKSLNDALNNR